MFYTIIQLYGMIITIGIFTFLTRALFLYVVPKIFEHDLLKRGMNAVPSAMLVALVIPFTFVEENDLVIFKIEVVAILVTVIFVYFTKKYGYGLMVALAVYFLLNII